MPAAGGTEHVDNHIDDVDLPVPIENIIIKNIPCSFIITMCTPEFLQEQYWACRESIQ